MDSVRIARWGIVFAALFAGFGVAGRDAAAPSSPPAPTSASASDIDPLAAETLPVPAPEPAGAPSARGL